MNTRAAKALKKSPNETERVKEHWEKIREMIHLVTEIAVCPLALFDACIDVPIGAEEEGQRLQRFCGDCIG